MADTQVVVYFLIIYFFLILTAIVGLVIAKQMVDGKPDQVQAQHEEEGLNTSYVSPVLKELSPKQIADIHSRGKITPAEYVEQWESTGMCWVISEDRAAPWCERFRHNCHDCFVAMANENDEHTSLWDFLRPANIDI